MSVKITDFDPYEQSLLRAAWAAKVPLVLVGFRQDEHWPAFVIALGPTQTA